MLLDEGVWKYNGDEVPADDLYGIFRRADDVNGARADIVDACDA